MSDNPIDALLKAEHDAEDQIARCKDDARATINQALEQARVIRERADQRIGAIHSHCAAALDAESLRLWQDYALEPKTAIDEQVTPEHIDAIAIRVAARLTGEPDA